MTNCNGILVQSLTIRIFDFLIQTLNNLSEEKKTSVSVSNITLGLKWSCSVLLNMQVKRPE